MGRSSPLILFDKSVCYFSCDTYRLILQIGFNKGDGVLGYEHPYSMTPAVFNMFTDTNVGDTGRWMYRVDDNITDCVSSGKYSIDLCR